MTTSHRPQLEARSGAKAAGYTPTSTEHARLLPGHKTVKYRSSNKVSSTEKNYLDYEREKVNALKDKVTENNEEEGEEEEIEEEEEEEDDDDDELLQRELDRLKNKRLEEEAFLVREHEEEQVSEPKLKRKSWRQGTTFSRNKVSKTSNSTVKQDKSKTYINNITKSDYHQEFMKKFIR
ncbi:pre-mRNA-splicing factor Cwc15p [Monosporozyma servazzii]